MGDTDAAEQARIDWAVTAASAAVRAYTGLSFQLATEATPGPREFRYYEGGIIDIDEASAVNTVSTKATTWSSSRTLDNSEWFAMPKETPIFTYVEVYTRFLPTGVAPEMGFKNNLDTYPFVPYPTVVVVDATWGWTEIPVQVKQATVFTAADYATTDPAEFNSESIAGYSRSRAPGRLLTMNPIIQPVPDRAAALLEAYTRWAV